MVEKDCSVSQKTADKIDKVKILESKILSANWYILRKIKYGYYKNDGSKQTQSREAYDRGNGAIILL